MSAQGEVADLAARDAAEAEADKRYPDTGLANNVAWGALQAGALWQREQAAPSPAATVAEGVALDAFDAGELNTYGGGNVGWWLDYIRALLGDAHQFYQEQVGAPSGPADARVRELEAALRIAREALVMIGLAADAANRSDAPQGEVISSIVNDIDRWIKHAGADNPEGQWDFDADLVELTHPALLK